MTEWWEALSSLGKVFACIAIPATLVLLIQTILSIIGLSGSDGDADVPDGGIDIDGDGIPDVFPDAAPDGVFGSDVPDDGDAPDSGFRLLSLRTIIAFLTIFGWVGLITLKQGLPTAWSLIINKASNKKSFTVTITVSAYSAKVGKDILVTYSAIVNENAIERDKETNTATLKYSNDPNNAASYGYASDTANLYSFNVKVDKHAADNAAKKLVGAEFYFKNSSGQYYKRDETTKNVTWVLNKAEATMLSSDTNGVLTFTGIDMGTYYLEETKAPDGYNLLSGDVTVVINKNAANNGYVATVDLHSATVAADDLTVTASIANSTGTMLPETGGTGTIIFIVVGAVAVIGAGLFLVTNKRMSKEGI